MITETKDALAAIRDASASPDSAVAERNAALFSFIRSTGMRPLQLADGSSALGSRMHDGTFFVLQTKEGNFLPTDPTRLMPEWVAKRLDGKTGQGIALGKAAPMLEAYRVMLALPSPILENGEVREVEGDSLDEILEAVNPVVAPRM